MWLILQPYWDYWSRNVKPGPWGVASSADCIAASRRWFLKNTAGRSARRRWPSSCTASAGLSRTWSSIARGTFSGETEETGLVKAGSVASSGSCAWIAEPPVTIRECIIRSFFGCLRILGKSVRNLHYDWSTGNLDLCTLYISSWLSSGTRFWIIWHSMPLSTSLYMPQTCMYFLRLTQTCV